MADNQTPTNSSPTAGGNDFGRDEPSALSGGKRFHKEVQNSWRQASAGESVVPEAPMDLHRWKDVAASQRGSRPFRYPKNAKGRADIRVLIDEDDQGHQHVSILEIKNTEFDHMTPQAVRRNLISHRRQLLKYIASELDLGNPHDFNEDEAFVVPG
jgi:hypothetical protein